MYNLLVHYMSWKGGTGTVPRDRLFEYTDDTLENQFKNGDSILFLIPLDCKLHLV